MAEMWDHDVETTCIAEQIENASRLLTRHIEDVVRRSPFYRKKFSQEGISVSAIQGVEDLHKVPLSTKSEIKEAQDASPPFGPHLGIHQEKIRRVFQTSGSTGTPTLLAVTARDLEIWRSIGARSYTAAGMSATSSVLLTFGAGPFVAGHIHALLDEMGPCVVPVSPGDTERSLRVIELGIVDTYVGTPTFALHLANSVSRRQNQPHALALKHIITGGEPGGGLPEIRNQLEGTFSAQVREIMGVGDISPSLFGECHEQDGMHFCGQGFVWPELIDANTSEPIEFEAGAYGELVYTSLEREAMPLIRFRSGDLVHITDTRCKCGRTSFKMRCVGRSDDTFIVRGVNVFPSAIGDVTAEFRPFVTGRARAVIPRDTSVSIEPPIHVEVEVPDGSEQPENLAVSVESRIRSKLLFRAAVSFVPESQFGDSSYKTRPVARSN